MNAGKPLITNPNFLSTVELMVEKNLLNASNVAKLLAEVHT